MSLFDSSLPGITVLVDVPFPSNCVGGPGIAVDKTDPTSWLVELDYPPLVENDSLQPSSNYYFAVYDQTLGMYERARLDKMVSSATGLDTRTVMGDANYIALATDRYIGIASPFTLNRQLSLPPASSVPGGREILVQDEIGTLTASHYLVILPTGTDTISGKANRLLSTPYGGLRLRSNGTNAWNAIATNSLTPVNDSAYFCNADDKVIAFTALTASRNVTLPAAATYPPGQRLIVLDQNGQCSATLHINVLPAGSDLVNGLGTPVSLQAAYAYAGFVSDGVSKWTIVDQPGGGGGSGTITSSQITDASPLGRLLLTQATAALDRTSLGSGNTGDAMFVSATPAAGRAVLGVGVFGETLFQEPTPAQARTDLQLGTMATQNANAVAITGGTITGISGLGGSVTISDTAPASPTAGSMWFDSVGGQLYLWYNDGTSSQWVVATNQNLSGIYLPLTGGTLTGALTGQALTLSGTLTGAAANFSGALTAASFTGPRVGVTDGSNAAAGQVGEYLTATNTGNPTTNVWTSYITLPLTAGDWDVWMTENITFSANGQTVYCGISSTTSSANLLAGGTSGYGLGSSIIGQWAAPCGPCRVSLSAPANIYGLVYALYASGSCTVTGAVNARRVR